jgi:hypothetical protein
MRKQPASKRQISEILRRCKRRDENRELRKEYTMIAIGKRHDMVSSTVNYLAKGFNTNNFSPEIVASIRKDYQRSLEIDKMILEDRAKSIGDDLGLASRTVENIWLRNRLVKSVTLDSIDGTDYHRMYTKPISASPGPFSTYY